MAEKKTTRKNLLTKTSLSLSAAVLAKAKLSAQVDTGPGKLGKTHLAAKAKRVIFLCMSGGPSHLETFDYKPELDKLNGKAMPESFTKGQPIAQLQGTKLKAQGHLTKFKQYGQSGQWISDYLPYHQKMADDICIIRSMKTEQINHDPAQTFINTGTAISGRPSMGSWVNYGLGAESEELPGYVVMTSVGGRNPQPISSRQWSAGFLPSEYQGVQFNSSGDPVNYVKRPSGVNRIQQRGVVDAIKQLDQYRNEVVNNPEITARQAAFEMAYRMQSSVPELMDISSEPQHILDMYGAKPGDGSYASNCLLARKLAEKGVRFIQLYHRGWDHHNGLIKYMNMCCGLTDQATWALVNDLKQRGMLDDTLIIWGGEFGRTPMSQTNKGKVGRDHHMKGFSMWMAGGGIKGGMNYGNTDELGYNAIENVVHVRDLHATILHQLGINHLHLRVPFQGLDLGLTGVEESHVLKDIIA